MTTKETLIAIHKHVPGFNKLCYSKVKFAIENGNTEIAATLMEASLRTSYVQGIEKNTNLKLLRDPSSLED